jgi:tetratricopeptide (TPR) repeat protein
MTHQTNWLPGLITLGVGLAVAIFFALLQRRKAAPAVADDSAALDAKYQALLIQLKEHAASKHLATPEAWQVEQTRLEQAAAQVLRDKANVKHETLKTEARAGAMAKAAEAPQGFFAKNPALAGALWGGGAVAFFVFLGMSLSTESTARVDDGKGPMMGNGQVVTPQPSNPNEPPEDPRLAAALARAEREPDDVEVLANAANELIKRQMFDDAAPLVARATLIDPYHVKTRIYRTVLSALSGPPMTALAELEHLADTYEGAYQARLYAGALAAQTGSPERALKSFERYLEEAPKSEHPPMLQQGIAELRAEIAHQGAAPK